MLADWASCNMYIESASPGEAKTWDCDDFCFEKKRKKTEFECKIMFLYEDNRNGQKHTHTDES